MIGYATLGTNDRARAGRFYDALLGEVGARRLLDNPSGLVMWGRSWNEPALALTPPHDGAPATSGNGTMVALRMDSREQVALLHRRALELGGSDEGAPGVRGSEGPQAFYGAYFRDPDGNKLALFRVGPAAS